MLLRSAVFVLFGFQSMRLHARFSAAYAAYCISFVSVRWRHMNIYAWTTYAKTTTLYYQRGMALPLLYNILPALLDRWSVLHHFCLPACVVCIFYVSVCVGICSCFFSL